MIRIDEDEFLQLASFIKINYGINLFNKKSLIEGRLSIMLSEKRYTSFSEYINKAFGDVTKTEITELVNKLTTNHTFFMREPKHFDFLVSKVLPFLKGSIKDNDLRIWSAGCSSGEEPYTLAMIIADYFDSEKPLWDTKILATDISVRALELAGEGIYSADAIKDLPTAWKIKNFHQIADGKFEVSDDLKNEIIFRVFNLMDSFYPFKKKFHVIFCRNVMIYFDYETRKRLVDKLYEAIEPGGFLFIGHSETIARNDSKFKYVIPSVYQKEKD